MSTKQQLHAMKFSGLNEKDQWDLLNSKVPLIVLDQHNQAQNRIVSAYLAARSMAAPGKSTISASLQNDTSSRKLGELQAATRNAIRNGASSRDLMQQKKDELWNRIDVNPVKQNVPQATPPPTKTPPSNTPQGTLKSTGIFLLDLFNLAKFIFSDKSSADESPKDKPKQTPKPDEFWFSTVPPTATPTPTPKPISTPIPESGKPPVSAQKETMLDKGFKFIGDAAKNNLPYCFDTKNHNRYGKGKDPQFDCSGLGIAFLEACGCKLKFTSGYISNNCAGMVDSIRGTDYGTIPYDYKKDQDLPELQRGDFVFYADPKNLGKDVHVAVATGEVIYDPIKKVSYPEVIEASSFAKKVTGQYLAYNDTNTDGLYKRDHSGQIITHVVQWNLEWDDLN